MRHSAKLTQAAVDAASPRLREYIIVDGRSDGLALRVRPNGSKTWQLRWKENGRLRRATIGDAMSITLAHARKRAADSSWVRDDHEPDHAPQGVSFGDLAMAFIEMKERSGLKSQSPRIYARSQLIPAFGHVPTRELSTPRIASWFHGYSATRPGGANEALRVFRAVLDYGKEAGLIPRDTPDPSAPIRKNPRRKVGRILSADGLAALGHVLARPDFQDPDATDAISLILLTGCRSGEIIRLRWDEVQRDRLQLKRTKTGPRDVLLSKPAARILARRKRAHMGIHVFPAHGTISRSRSNVDAAWKRIKAQAGIDPKFRLHDLRHSYASHAVMSGETLVMAGKLLGHRTPASTPSATPTMTALSSRQQQNGSVPEWPR